MFQTTQHCVDHVSTTQPACQLCFAEMQGRDQHTRHLNRSYGLDMKKKTSVSLVELPCLKEPQF